MIVINSILKILLNNKTIRLDINSVSDLILGLLYCLLLRNLKMSKLILTVGTSECGKTTWAEEYCRQNPNTVNLCRDDIRFSLMSPGGTWDTYEGHHYEEAHISRLMQRKYNVAKMLDKDIIISDTNLNPMTRYRWVEIAKRFNQEIEYVIFNTAFVNMFYKNSSNLFMLPNHIVESQYKKFTKFLEEAPIPDVKYTVI